MSSLLLWLLGSLSCSRPAPAGCPSPRTCAYSRSLQTYACPPEHPTVRIHTGFGERSRSPPVLKPSWSRGTICPVPRQAAAGLVSGAAVGGERPAQETLALAPPPSFGSLSTQCPASVFSICPSSPLHPHGHAWGPGRHRFSPRSLGQPPPHLHAPKTATLRSKR